MATRGQRLAVCTCKTRRRAGDAAVLDRGDAVVAEAVQRSDIGGSAGACEREWIRVLNHLKGEVGEAIFRSWLGPMSAKRVDDGQAIVVAPTRFLRDWVETRYGDRIRTLWHAENRQ